MKKVLIILTVLLLSFALFACGSGSSSNKDKPKDTSKATIGSFEIAIKDYEVKQDDEGNDAVFITFDFTNNGEEEANYDTALYGECFQNGVELDFGDVYIGEDTTDPSYENKYKDIQQGTTIEVKEAFILQDKENPITVKVVSMNEIMGGNSEGTAEKEFKIAE